MPFTAKLGTADSRPGNIVPGLGSQRFIPTLTTTTPAALVVEVAFPNNPIDLSGYRNTVLNDGPISYWRMDNITSLTDLAGNGNTMTLENAPTLVTSALSGDSNQALSFNGTDEAGIVPTAASLAPSGNASLEGWIYYPSAPGTNRTLFGATKSYWLEIRTDGKIQFSVRKGVTVTTLVSATTLTTATFYHVAAVYDGANLKIYLNGNQDATTSYSAGIDTYPLNFTASRTDNSTASPGFRGASSASTSSAGTSIGWSTPAATVAGDYLIASVASGISNSISSVPAGWTLLAQTGAVPNTFMYGKVASSADAGGGASYTWTFANSTTPLLGQMMAMSNVGAVATAVTSNNTASSSTSVATSLTPLFNNTTVLSQWFNMNSGDTWTITGATEQYEQQAGRVAGATVTVSTPASQSLNGSGASASNRSVVAVEVIGPVGAFSYTASRLDELAVWNVALSPTQVAAHFAAASVSPTTIVWTDISADVRECKIVRGRQAELDQIQAGTATLLLKDALRNYDPANHLGAYAPNVKPLRMIRIRALFNSVYYPLFRGYVERWESRWETGVEQSYAEAEITAVDGFEPLSLSAPVGSVPAGVSGVTISSLLSRANWSGDQRIIDPGAFNTIAITLDGSTSVLSHLQSVANGEAGLFFIDASGNAVFHDKNHRTTVSLSTTSQALFGDVPDGSLPYTALESPSSDKDRIINDWHVDDSAGGDHQASDTPSILTFFRRTQNRSTLLSAADATTMAAFLLSRTKDPGYRVDAVELTPGTALEVWTQALTREISDRITVEAQPVGTVPAAQVKKDFWIERVEWQWRHGLPARVRWQLSPAT